MRESNAAALGKVAVLGELRSEDVEKLEKRCKFRHYGSHEIIIDRHSESRDVYFVLRGSVRVVNYSLSGREVTFDDLPAGSYFGELAALDNQPRSANCMALTETDVAALSQDAFQQLLLQHPEVALRIMKAMAQVIRNSTERIMDLSTLGANNRVYAELLRLAKAGGDGDDTTAVVKPIPIHGDIASRVSTTRETVARVLGDLSRKGLVKRQPDALLITDLDRLTEMVEEFRGE